MTSVLLSWSGGKDSALTLERLQADATVRVVGLLTSVSTEFDRISIHGVRRSLLHRQAESVGLPLYEIPLAPKPSNETYEAAFATALAKVQEREHGLDTIAFGDLFLEDVRTYRQTLLARLGWTGLYPIWGEPTRALAEHFIERGYRAVLTCVDTQQLSAEFAGREFDAKLLADLPPTVDPCGERGEFHTFVYDSPVFRTGVQVQLGERVRREDRFEYCDLLEVAVGRGAGSGHP